MENREVLLKEHHILLYRIGSLAPAKMQEVIERLVDIITHE